MEQEEKKPTTLTGVDLSQTASLLLPWTHDPWGKLRPPLSEEALCMSAELASAAYGMAIEPWVEAGWRDVTIQVDGELTALPPNNPLSAEWRKYWVRARLKPVSALGQMLGALRLSSSNNTTGKAVVMLHPALDGRYVVAVGFMGTGSRFYDWFSNFRMTTQDGMHRGFLELARQFEANEEKISFPETAEELGLEKQKFTRVSIFMSVFNVHVNRAPTEGKITKAVYVPGKFLNATLDKASKDNERQLLAMKTKNGQDIAFVQIAGLVARRIVCDAAAGQEYKTGERFGMIRFGSRLDVYLPLGTNPQVALGQTMVAGETIIANLGSEAPEVKGVVR